MLSTRKIFSDRFRKLIISNGNCYKSKQQKLAYYVKEQNEKEYTNIIKLKLKVKVKSFPA